MRAHVGADCVMTSITAHARSRGRGLRDDLGCRRERPRGRGLRDDLGCRRERPRGRDCGYRMDTPRPGGEVKIGVLFRDETAWLTPRTLAELFGVKALRSPKYPAARGVIAW